MITTRRRLLVPVLGVGLLIGATACSNRESGVNRRPTTGATTAAAEPDGVQHVTISADDTYRFTPSTITVHPGKIEITLINKGSGAPHDLSVTGFPADFVPLASSGQTTTATFVAPAPGKYQFVCTIHVTQGQTGTLIVLPN